MKQTNLLIASIVAGSIALSSCATTNPYTGERQTSKATTGAVVGALGGAAIGALIGNNRSSGSSRKYAIRGAVAGALAGGGIGHYMDQQEAQIRQQLESTGVSVTRIGNDLVLNIPSDITFKTGSSQLHIEFDETLKSVALILKKYNKTSISITGHTDSAGSASYNQDLSVSRATSVARLLGYNGVASNRTFTYGEGETSPIASNKTASGKAKNRRVELKIVPQQKYFQ